jgi:hypothetical protein
VKFCEGFALRGALSLFILPAYKHARHLAKLAGKLASPFAMMSLTISGVKKFAGKNFDSNTPVSVENPPNQSVEHTSDQVRWHGIRQILEPIRPPWDR